MKEQHEGVKRYEKAAMEKRGMRKRECESFPAYQ
jgi:hypothetical protein